MNTGIPARMSNSRTATKPGESLRCDYRKQVNLTTMAFRYPLTTQSLRKVQSFREGLTLRELILVYAGHDLGRCVLDASGFLFASTLHTQIDF
jgi:hypothetical protein